ncbi:beta-ketoacyl reductase, partial [Streptomyces sp. NPDC088116]|uniref:beta-ketoacyl reductase n=1 Tax=Streptomyces sp. NPDC088116 TaxID=3365825 RepID=UPI00380325CE
TWGSGGQSLYAAANAHLDALAQQRHTHHQPATSIAWGLWGGDGMGAADGVTEFYAERGLAPMPPELAIEAMERALSLGDTCVTVADIKWERFVTGYTAFRSSPLISDIPEVRETRPVVQAVAASDDLRRRIDAAMTPRERNDVLVDLVRSVAAEVLGHENSDSIGHDVAFRELGFDSLSAVKLRGRLAGATGLVLPATVIFDHPTVDRLGAALLDKLTGDRAGEGRTAAVSGADSTHRKPDIAPDTPADIDELSAEELIRLAKAGSGLSGD